MDRWPGSGAAATGRQQRITQERTVIQQLGDNHLQKYANHENKPLDHGYKIGIGVLGQLTTSIRLAGRMPIKLIINILYTYYDTTIKYKG